MPNVDQSHGFFTEMKGKLKQLFGRATGDRKTQAKGAIQEAGGQIQQGFGNLREKIEQPKRV